MKKIITLKKTLFFLAMLTSICIYSCKKDKFTEEKPSLDQISISPEKFGYNKFTENAINDVNLKLDKDFLSSIRQKFNVYYNEESNSLLILRNSITTNRSIDFQFEVKPDNCICSGSAYSATDPPVVDDSCLILEYPSVRVDNVDRAVFYGPTHGVILGGINGENWISGEGKIAVSDYSVKNAWDVSAAVSMAIDEFVTTL